MINFLHDHYVDRYNGHWYDNSWVYKYLRNFDLMRDVHRHIPPPFNEANMAATAMSVINSLAKGTLSEVSDEIYWAKRKLTKYLYLHYPTDVQLLKQTLVCKSCAGTGEYRRYDWDEEWAEECYRCNGTGIYRTVEIVAFTFWIDGVDFRWHMPRTLCDFDVYIPAEVGEYKDVKQANFSVPDGDNYRTYLRAYLLVQEFLWRVGYVDSHITLLRALRVDLSRIRHNLPRVLRYRFDEFKDWLIGDADYYPPYTIRRAWEQDDIDDCIPF